DDFVTFRVERPREDGPDLARPAGEHDLHRVASARARMCSSTRKWIRWMTSSDQILQYAAGHIRFVYQVVPSSLVLPPAIGSSTNRPRCETRKFSRCGGASSGEGGSSRIDGGCALPPKS